jgi:uncharacterized protein YkwD
MILAFLLSTGVPTMQPATRLLAEGTGTAGQSARRPTLQPAVAKASDMPVNDQEFQSERQLLALANQSRRQAGAPPLALDAGLSRAARIHAQAMLQAQRLSHQFEGEPSLPQRLAATTELQLEQEGENVALDYDAEHGHQHLMLSPPHRANLLNASYNVVGLAAVRSGDRLYIVQDFGSALPKYSSAETKNHVAAAVNQVRRQESRPELQRHDSLGADDAACAMARADKLGVSPDRNIDRNMTESFSVLAYTTLHPDALPGGAARTVAVRTLHSFSIGACYARTPTYPTGTYWVVLSLE